MALSNDLISQFVKVTKDEKKPVKETTAYGVVTKVEYFGDKITNVMVRLDGATIDTPISSTSDVIEGDRVIVMIKNHTAVITGNITSPSARTEVVRQVVTTVTEMDQIIAEKVSTKQLAAEIARIDSLVADNAVVHGRLEAAEAEISALEADSLEVHATLRANDADIKYLKANILGADQVEATFATIEMLEAAEADIDKLEAAQAEFESAMVQELEAQNACIQELNAKKLSATDIEGKYANIDFSNISKATMQWFYANSGLIEDVVVGDGHITGKLVGVTIIGDLIEGGTVKADKLVIKGTDGLYYKLNTDGVKTEAEQTEYNSINGNVILAKSITATKIKVDDLVAFDATIGGFSITNNSLYSGVKATVNTTIRGIYLDSTGQMAVGDASNFIKYYKDSNGSYKLAISADSLVFGSSKKSIETALDEIQASVDDIEIGGRNLLLGSATKKITPYQTTSVTNEYGVEVTEWLTDEAMRIYGTGGTSTIFGTMGGVSCQGASDETKMYSASIYIKNNHSTNTVTITGNHLGGAFVNVAPLEEKRVELVGLGNGWGYLQFNFKTSVAGDEFDITYWHPKIEFGNKPTDWTPAPEDMATADDLNIVEATAENANARASSAESLIQQLSDNISMLVTDGNGTSLMTQTEDGWTFSTAAIQTVVNRVSDDLGTLTDELGDTNNAVGILQQAVKDLGEIAEYVKIGTYEDEPCIELGESDSDFKLRITNTRMIFAEGSSVLAYFNNKSLYIKKAVVEEELQQGGFVWQARSNGNLGLVWKGGSN